MPVDKASLQALKNILTEIDLLVSTSPQPMPQNRTPRCLELTKAALALTDEILKQTRMAPAVVLGRHCRSTIPAVVAPERGDLQAGRLMLAIM